MRVLRRRASTYELGLLARAVDRAAARGARSCAAGCTSRSLPARPAGASTVPAHARCSSTRSRRSRGRRSRCRSPSMHRGVTVAIADRRTAARVAHRLGAGDADAGRHTPAGAALAPRHAPRPGDDAVLGPGRRTRTSRASGKQRRPAGARRDVRRRRAARSASFPPPPGSSSTSRARREPYSPPRRTRTTNRGRSRWRSRRAAAEASRRPQAQAMGITGTVGTYETIYGGDPNRIHNVQLVAHLVDSKLIAPGATFSFNGTTGERTAEKGFLEAPVIVNGELQTGLGGGVCQVSTTVFNAAYEAGLPITARTNHALYISHYPLGRDATVNYPDIDLKFVNDTGHWLLLRTWVGPSSLTVALYGTPQHRRVETIERSRCAVVAPPPVQKTVDATLKPGQVVVDDPACPRSRRRSSARSTPPAASSCPTRRGTRATGPSRRSSASARRSRRRRRRRRPRRRPRPRPARRRPVLRRSAVGSALAIASRSHPARGWGGSVPASTVAWAVQPSAISSPPRSIAYS